MNIISDYQVDGHTATKEDRLRKIQELTESGDESVVSHNMDIAFQLFTLGAEYVDRAIDLLAKYGLNEKKIKMKADNFNASFDALNKALFPLYETEKAKIITCDNYDVLHDIFDAILQYKQFDIVRGEYYQPKLYLPKKQ